MSVDPYMRPRMNDVKSYIPPFQLDQALDGEAIGEVISSNSTSFQAGDLVLHRSGWRDYAVLAAAHVTRIDDTAAPVNAYLGVLGMTGLTAYAGLMQTAELIAGDSVYVSSAAGAVGQVVGQLAKLRGAARVIGSAGSDVKVAKLVDELGFDAAFNYHHGPVVKQLAAAAPKGIDVYFDNVGGEHLEAAIAVSNVHARITLCGAVSAYNSTQAGPGPRNLSLAIGKRLQLRGLLVSDHGGLREEFLDCVGGLVRDGKLRYDETVVDGLEQAPHAFIAMLRGETTGKTLVMI